MYLDATQEISMTNVARQARDIDRQIKMLYLEQEALNRQFVALKREEVPLLNMESESFKAQLRMIGSFVQRRIPFVRKVTLFLEEQKGSPCVAIETMIVSLEEGMDYVFHIQINNMNARSLVRSTFHQTAKDTVDSCRFSSDIFVPTMSGSDDITFAGMKEALRTVWIEEGDRLILYTEPT